MVVFITDDVPHQMKISEKYPGCLLWPGGSVLDAVTHFPAKLIREFHRADTFLMGSICL